MDKQQARDIVRDTLGTSFDKGRFTRFVKELLNEIDESEKARFINQGNYIPDAYKQYISSLERIGKYSVGDHTIDILIVKLKKETSIERARTMQRNFIARYLNGSRGGELKDAALVAFVSPDSEDWRFSLVKMDYRFEEGKNGKVKVKEEFTPARRWSFLVGQNENSHTAQTKLFPFIADDGHQPTLAELEEAFNIEKVTKEFFEKYRDLFCWAKEELDKLVDKDNKIKMDFAAKGVNTVDFAKKLLGQIVFLYFLQKKGWFGVDRDAAWGTGSKHFLRELYKKKHGGYNNFFNDILEPLFYEALRLDRGHEDHYYSRFNCKIPFLNGGLFDPMNNYDWVRTDILIDNELFSNQHKTKEGDEGNGILDVFDRYNFTVKEDEPLEKEVAIDPELLGKAYEKFNAIRPDNFEEYKQALKSGKKGEESKFNKQFGVYYTPREIVHYMCQQSLINYLYAEFNGGAITYENPGIEQTDMLGNVGKRGQLDLTIEHKEKPAIPKEDIETLIHYGERITENEEISVIKKENINAGKQKTAKTKSFLSENIHSNAKEIDAKLASIRVCDPAIGSGAFPVGMMNEIVRARKVLCNFIKDNEHSIYSFKRQCIENSLYGVDIDSGAVEIAKLRLWLSLVVDEDDIRQIKPLPNLDYKIVCGNSLIGFPDKWDSPVTKEIESLKHEFISETNPTRKKGLKEIIDGKISDRYEKSLKTFGYRINFDFRTAFSEVFHEKEGFDVVIGNPPYVQLQKIKKTANLYEKQNYKTFTRTGDVYCLFYEKGINLLKAYGTLTYITSNSWMRTQYGEPLRKFFWENTNPLQLINFEDYQIFESVTVETNILITTREKNRNRLTASIVTDPFEINEAIIKNRVTLTDLGSASWYIGGLQGNEIKFKIEKVGILLNKLGMNIFRGLLTGCNEAFIIDTETKNSLVKADKINAKIIKPMLGGRDLKKYSYQWGGKWIINTHNGIRGQNILPVNVQKEYPVIYEYLNKFKEQLKPRADQGMHWTNLRNCAYIENFDKPKIVWGEISDTAKFAFDEDKHFIEATAFIMTGNYLKYLLAILNSSPSVWYFNIISTTTGMGTNRWKKYKIEQLPIPRVPIENIELQQPFIILVDRILSITQSDDYPQNKTKQAKVKEYEDEIDQMIYKLYDLTPAEIAIVEGK